MGESSATPTPLPRLLLELKRSAGATEEGLGNGAWVGPWSSMSTTTKAAEKLRSFAYLQKNDDR